MNCAFSALMLRLKQGIPDSFMLITRRCIQGECLLRPDEETNNAFAYCLADAAERFDIDIVLSIAESNRHHTIIYDRHGQYAQFMGRFHRTLAACLNVHRQRRENFWASGEARATRLPDRAAVIAALIDGASKPVKDNLVERATEWPGHNGYRMLLGNRTLRARRPQFYFKPGGPMPTEVTLRLTIPAVLGTAAEVIAEVRDGVQQVEAVQQVERARSGRRVLRTHCGDTDTILDIGAVRLAP